MNNISDYEAHRRDEDYDNSAEFRRHWNALPKCPIHGVPLIVASFSLDPITREETKEFYPGGACPECIRNDARRLSNLQRQCGTED